MLLDADAITRRGSSTEPLCCGRRHGEQIFTATAVTFNGISNIMLAIVAPNFSQHFFSPFSFFLPFLSLAPYLRSLFVVDIILPRAITPGVTTGRVTFDPAPPRPSCSALARLSPATPCNAANTVAGPCPSRRPPSWWCSEALGRDRCLGGPRGNRGVGWGAGGGGGTNARMEDGSREKRKWRKWKDEHIEEGREGGMVDRKKEKKRGKEKRDGK